MPASILEAARRLPRRRDLALAGSFVAAAGLLGQAALLSLQAPREAGKSIVRLDAGAIEKRELSFTPQFAVADDSLRQFKPGAAWTPQPVAAPVEMNASSAPMAALQKPAPRFRLAAASTPLPPPRPASLLAKAQPVAVAPAPAAEKEIPAKVSVATGGFELPRFRPIGAVVMRRLGDVGSSIGAVGASLGRMMRISER